MTTREVVAASRHPLIGAVFIACAMVLGGGGSPNPGTEVLLQMVFVAACLAWLWVPARQGAVPVPRSRSFWVVCALVLVLPLVQLVPLPPSVWTVLSGHDDRTAALALVGAEQAWQPLSHSWPRTLAGLLAIIPALFAFFAAASLDARGRAWLVGAIAVTTLAASLLGALQVSLGVDGAPYLYAENSGTLTGFQANRNAAADVLLIGLVATAAFLVPALSAPGSRRPGARRGFLADRRMATIGFACAVAVLFFAVLLTASRTGILLLPLAMAGVWVVLLPALADSGRLRLVPAAAALVAIPLAGFIALGAGNTVLGKIAARFAMADDPRRELWADAWYATEQAWPFGVGVGGAQPALIAAERLEVLDPTVPNRVHNDYLELALEGGLPALILLGLIAVILVAMAWRSWRSLPQERHLTALGIVILLVVAVHSFVDYPLRSMALACLVGTGAGLLLSTPRKLAQDEPAITDGVLI